jgi:hypothetical protein
MEELVFYLRLLADRVWIAHLLTNSLAGAK